MSNFLDVLTVFGLSLYWGNSRWQWRCSSDPWWSHQRRGVSYAGQGASREMIRCGCFVMALNSRIDNYTILNPKKCRNLNCCETQRSLRHQRLSTCSIATQCQHQIEFKRLVVGEKNIAMWMRWQSGNKAFKACLFLVHWQSTSTRCRFAWD